MAKQPYHAPTCVLETGFLENRIICASNYVEQATSESFNELSEFDLW